MPTITKEVGAGKFYTTLLLWEADLDLGSIYSAGDIARADCFKGVIFDGNHLIDGGETIGLSGIEITASQTQRHTGVAGSGVKFHYGSGFWAFQPFSDIPTTIEWVEVTTSDGGGGNHRGILVSSANQNHPLRNCLLHHFSLISGAYGITGGGNFNTSYIATNNIVYACNVGIGADSSAHIGIFDNNTIHNAALYGFKLGSNSTAQNNIATDSGSSDYFGSSGVADHNLSSDTTATGSGSLILKVASNQFISTLPGAENLHLKAGSDALLAALDLVLTPDGVQIDIDGRDRDANNDTWDMGAHQFSISGGGGIPVSKVSTCNFEALEMFSTTTGSRIEWIISMSHASGASIESLQQLERIASVDLESLSGVSLVSQSVYEFLGAETLVSKAVEASWEVLGATFSSRTSEIEVLTSVAVAALVDLESLQGIAKTLAPILEGMRGLSQSFQSGYEALGTEIGVSLSFSSSIEVLGLLDYTKSNQMEAVQGINGFRSGSLEARGLIEMIQLTDIETRQFVSAMSSVEHEYLQGVSKASGASVEGLLGIEVQRASVYEADLGVQVVDITLELQAVFAPDIEVIAEF